MPEITPRRGHDERPVTPFAQNLPCPGGAWALPTSEVKEGGGVEQEGHLEHGSKLGSQAPHHLPLGIHQLEAEACRGHVLQGA